MKNLGELADSPSKIYDAWTESSLSLAGKFSIAKKVSSYEEMINHMKNKHLIRHPRVQL